MKQKLSYFQKIIVAIICVLATATLVGCDDKDEVKPYDKIVEGVLIDSSGNVRNMYFFLEKHKVVGYSYTEEFNELEISSKIFVKYDEIKLYEYLRYQIRKDLGGIYDGVILVGFNTNWDEYPYSRYKKMAENALKYGKVYTYIWYDRDNLIGFFNIPE